MPRLKLVVINHKGGVAKTTTAVNLARAFSDRGLRVLLIDTDSQSSVTSLLNLAPTHHLYDFIVHELALRECVVTVSETLDVLCSSRKTQTAEKEIQGRISRDLTFELTLDNSGADKPYDVVLIDVAPSLSWWQTCAMIYARRILIPADMDMLAVTGAVQIIATAAELTKLFRRPEPITIAGILPTIVNRRLGITDLILSSMQQLADRSSTSLLPAIPVDATIPKANLAQEFLGDYAPQSKAWAAYQSVADQLLAAIPALEMPA